MSFERPLNVRFQDVNVPLKILQNPVENIYNLERYC